MNSNPDVAIEHVIISGIEFIIFTDKLERLSQLVKEVTHTSEDWGVGVSGSAVLGMNVIFESIPQKFPVEDLLKWLRYSIDPLLPLNIVEEALSQLAKIYL